MRFELLSNNITKKAHSQGAAIHSSITEVKQPQTQLILGWVTIQDTVLAAKDVTHHVPL